jgi:hypothetical protein
MRGIAGVRVSTLLGLLCVGLGFVFAPAPALSDQIRNAPVGTKVRDIAAISNHQVPLPPGEWVLAARQTVMSGGPGRAVRLVQIYLVQIQNNELARYVFIATNLDASGGGWARDPNTCDRSDKHYAYSDSNYNSHDVTCWYINNIGVTPAATASDLYRQFYSYSDDAKRPTSMMALNFYLVRGYEYLRVIYSHNPAAEGVAPIPLEGPWQIDAVRKDPKKKAYLELLRREGEATAAKLRDGLAGNLN